MQKRIMGIETEYGNLLVDNKGSFCDEDAGQILLNHVWANKDGEFRFLNMFWDNRYKYYPEEDFWLGSNGGKIMIDNQVHLEYSSPECANARDAALYSFAGDAIVERAVSSIRGSADFFDVRYKKYRDIFITKDNCDFLRESTNPHEEVKSYGSHESYLIPARFSKEQKWKGKNPYPEIFSSILIPFLVSRVILHGSGGLWWARENGWHYVLSPRALLTKKRYGVITVKDRPLIQIADERDSSGKMENLPQWVRLHLIYADSNMSHISTFLRFGTTSLALRLCEEKTWSVQFPVLENPIAALHAFASDPTLRETARAEDGNEYTALDLQKICLEKALRLSLSKKEKEICRLWERTIAHLEMGPEYVSRELDWAIKKSFLESSAKKHSYDLQDKKARIFCVRYSDLSDRGIFNMLKRAEGVETLFSDEEIRSAVLNPPPYTRAQARARYIRAVLKLQSGHPFLSDVAVGWHYLHEGREFEIDIKDPFCATNCELDAFLREADEQSKRTGE
ncbi:MAG: hypothetical protein A2934_02425 [Candidatus Sungbacteria bacterium RIFCSPLOWO2_01_FULL_47_10]|uniref:Uncharacterized protein n=1 Tax=Candidatus Sungbacteria bacterium RIFCSPLOWO2_01_FULL_47_10 TaxID=1802276 RepID=A0A1G2L726_9BACT|nr:MAG: hypothetical protein A2934_02425 [Candidatus Sungbacteria bacterium RIFCSPLOWO2_01_FULL_47_10]